MFGLCTSRLRRYTSYYFHVCTFIASSFLPSFTTSASYYRGSNSYNNYDPSLFKMTLDVCSDSVVVVTNMSISCDSPSTFYYGNGAHRNSPICDYGDKATLDFVFVVVDDLQEGDNEIYFTMATYDDSKSLLWSTYHPESLCDDYVGMDCTKQGTYSFQYKLRLGTPSGGNRTKFIPFTQIAFSTASDSGFNLGAVNIECQAWDEDQPVYMSWRTPETTEEKLNEGFVNYGMLVGTAILMILFSLGLWAKLYLDNQSLSNNMNEPYVEHDYVSSPSSSVLKGHPVQ